MNRRKLLQNGAQVSEVGLGCMSFAGFYGATSEQEAHQTLATALDLGIDFLDTANIYGMGLSETIIGNFIKGDADKFVIATKGAVWDNPKTGKRGFNNTASHLRTALDQSLTRLQVDQVALYYIHRRTPEIAIEQVMDTLLGFKAEGKIGGIGFSEISPASLRRACAVGPVDAVQSEYSLWSRSPELGMLQACAELDVTFVQFSPLARGIFAQETPDPATFRETDFRKDNPQFTEPNFGYNVYKINAFRALAQDLGTHPTSQAIAWCPHRGPHLIQIPGTRSSAHLTQCAEASTFMMTAEIMTQIETILPVGWAHGDRYTKAQWDGPEGYC